MAPSVSFVVMLLSILRLSFAVQDIPTTTLVSLRSNLKSTEPIITPPPLDELDKRQLDPRTCGFYVSSNVVVIMECAASERCVTNKAVSRLRCCHKTIPETDCRPHTTCIDKDKYRTLSRSSIDGDKTVVCALDDTPHCATMAFTDDPVSGFSRWICHKTATVFKAWAKPTEGRPTPTSIQSLANSTMPSTTNSTENSDSGLSKAQIALICIGVPGALVALGTIGWRCIWKRGGGRKKKVPNKHNTYTNTSVTNYNYNYIYNIFQRSK
ncbi:hypothetical protein QBC38DRAFT_548558 [Podospora fimiseda]|uniref:Mid2 domain-containing protein n=1 Tax=Podospora fimiseda TaxID=252190 RepID=A0AAN7BHB9_9PEZI|nr:hypothetical protein QBC38DRAFT_548558 [Podospora fimiseda]